MLGCALDLFPNEYSVIVAVIYELVYRNRIDTPHSMVKTWPITICKEVIQCTSIVSASAPQFKAFMESLQSSGLRLYDLPNPKSSGKSGSDGQRYPRTRSPSTLKCLTRPSQEYLEIDSVSGGNTTIDFEATATMDTRNSDWSRDNRPRQPNMI